MEGEGPMKNFIEKIKKIEELRSELDAHIWTIFYRYIKAKKILFSHPANWTVDFDDIDFDGTDGCGGCYDRQSCSIPLKYFIDPDKEFASLEERTKKEKIRSEKMKQQSIKQQELKELERLKKKYGVSNCC